MKKLLIALGMSAVAVVAMLATCMLFLPNAPDPGGGLSEIALLPANATDSQIMTANPINVAVNSENPAIGLTANLVNGQNSSVNVNLANTVFIQREVRAGPINGHSVSIANNYANNATINTTDKVNTIATIWANTTTAFQDRAGPAIAAINNTTNGNSDANSPPNSITTINNTAIATANCAPILDTGQSADFRQNPLIAAITGQNSNSG
jgi:hypothetical protein